MNLELTNNKILINDSYKLFMIVIKKIKKNVH